MTIIVLDNGGATVKCGIIGSNDPCRIIPNAVVRSKGDKMTYFGHEIERCKDYSALHYRLPIEKVIAFSILHMCQRLHRATL